MSKLIPKNNWIDEWFPEWNPGYLIRPLHGDAMPSRIRIDVADTEEGYTVKAELPGVKKEDIDVQIKDSLVSISAEIKQEDRQTKDDRVIRSERYFGRVSRSFELPSGVDPASCVATYNDGVLSLLLPKIEPKDDRHKIDIR